MTSTSASTVPSQQPRAVKQAAVITHGKPQAIGSALARLANVARESGVELHLAADESEKHGLEPEAVEPADVDIAVVLGGDGTMLRALARYLGTGVPVIGVNFGRVGFLASIERNQLESGLARVFAGEYRVEDVPTLDVEVGDERRVAVNDLVIASAVVGRMIQLEWAVGGEGLGRLGVRRPRLRDSLRLDGLQLLERRPGARLGPRRDGDHLRGAALAERASARGPARR